MARLAVFAATVVAALCFSGVATAAHPEGSLRFTLVANGDGEFGPQSFAQTETVYQRGRAVGAGYTACRWRGDFENPRCTITLSLARGSLVLFLRLEPDPDGSVRVTRGTGAYRGKTGVGIYHASGPAARYVLWLTSQRGPS